MIVLAQDAGLLAEACALFPASGTQIYGYFSRYGNQYPFCTTWLCQEEDGAVWGAMGRYNQSLRLSCGYPLLRERLGEVMEFLRISGCGTLEGPLPVLENLHMDSEIQSGSVMEYRGAVPETAAKQIDVSPRLDDVFQILRGSDPAFDAQVRFDEWLCDASHCLRHGGGWYAAVGKSATAGVTALSPGYGLIGSVATLPGERGRGYAILLVKWCVRRVLETGRIPVLMAADERAASLYRGIGFAETGRWGIINI